MKSSTNKNDRSDMIGVQEARLAAAGALPDSLLVNGIELTPVSKN